MDVVHGMNNHNCTDRAARQAQQQQAAGSKASGSVKGGGGGGQTQALLDVLCERSSVAGAGVGAGARVGLENAAVVWGSQDQAWAMRGCVGGGARIHAVQCQDGEAAACSAAAFINAAASSSVTATASS